MGLHPVSARCTGSPWQSAPTAHMLLLLASSLCLSFQPFGGSFSCSSFFVRCIFQLIVGRRRIGKRLLGFKSVSLILGPVSDDIRLVFFVVRLPLERVFTSVFLFGVTCAESEGSCESDDGQWYRFHTPDSGMPAHLVVSNRNHTHLDSIQGVPSTRQKLVDAPNSTPPLPCTSAMCRDQLQLDRHRHHLCSMQHLLERHGLCIPPSAVSMSKMTSGRSAHPWLPFHRHFENDASRHQTVLVSQLQPDHIPAVKNRLMALSSFLADLWPA